MQAIAITHCITVIEAVLQILSIWLVSLRFTGHQLLGLVAVVVVVSAKMLRNGSMHGIGEFDPQANMMC